MRILWYGNTDSFSLDPPNSRHMSLDEQAVGVLARVDPAVACVTESHEVRQSKAQGRCICPRRDMVRVQHDPGDFIGAASLAPIVIAAVGSSDKIPPLLSLVQPLTLRSDAPFPRGILSASLHADMRFAGRPDVDSMQTHVMANSARVHAVFGSDVELTAPHDDVFRDEIVSVFVCGVCSVMPIDIGSPPILPLIPLDDMATSALAERGTDSDGGQIFDGFATLSAGVGFPGVTGGDAVSLQYVLNRSRDASEGPRNQFDTGPRTIGITSGIHADSLLLEGGFPLIHDHSKNHSAEVYHGSAL